MIDDIDGVYRTETMISLEGKHLIRSGCILYLKHVIHDCFYFNVTSS
jgi:hypothetical protein